MAHHARMTFQFLETVNAALGLYQRYQKGAAFRLYVKNHGMEIVVSMLLLVVIACASTAATIVFVGGMRSWLVLLALIAAPIVLIGNLALLTYLFFSWVEGRAVATPRPQGRIGEWVHAKLGANLGTAPQVPWLLAALFVGLPFLMLFWLSWPIALVLALLALGLPVIYARLDHPGTAKA
jgi:hypothetical protein